MASHMKEFQKKCGKTFKLKWEFKPKETSIFHFGLVNDRWISHILYVKSCVQITELIFLSIKDQIKVYTSGLIKKYVIINQPSNPLGPYR